MTTRYFKATDGQITFFRGTGISTGFRYGWRARGHSRGYLGFSNACRDSKAAYFPATEITKAEFKALVALKAARVIASGGDNARESSPQDAWVDNAALAAEVVA
jgi:hypothetical protein